MNIEKGRRQVRRRVMRGAAIVLLLAANLNSMAGPAEAGAALTASQIEGQRLFGQSCAVCHTPPLGMLPSYGPLLSKESLGGEPEAMRTFISLGSARMPGFRYHFSPAQIDAIVQYLRSVDPRKQQSAPKNSFDLHGDV